MRIAVRTSDVGDERIRFLKQIGVEDVFPNPHPDPPEDAVGFTVRQDDVPTVAELTSIRDRFADHGVRFTGVHSLYPHIYDDIMFGREGRDDQIEAIQTLVRNMGEAGIGILGYQWNPAGVVEHVYSREEIRGGATHTHIDLTAIDDPEEPFEGQELDREYTEAEFWENYQYFLERVVPVAEDADVRLAVHPADPPVVEKLGGIPRLLRDFDAFKKAIELYDSDHHGLKLCLGCFSEMDEDVFDVVRYFGERDRIVMIHFRDVIGTMPTYTETFPDDPKGNYDEYRLAELLEKVGYTGPLLPDHYPSLEGDTDWQHASRGFSVGYIKALITVVRHESE